MQVHVEAFECDRCHAMAHTPYRVEKGETLCEACFMKIVVAAECRLDETKEKSVTKPAEQKIKGARRVGDGEETEKSEEGKDNAPT